MIGNVKYILGDKAYLRSIVFLDRNISRTHVRVTYIVIKREQIFIFVIRIEFIICHIEIKISGYTVIECIKILVVSLKRDSKSVRCGFNGYHNCHPFFRCPAEWR